MLSRFPGNCLAAVAFFSLLAAGPPPRLTSPSVLAVAPDGSLLLADLRQPGVFRRAPDGRLDVFASAGPKDRTPLRAVTALAIGPDGAVYAADRAAGDIYRLRPDSPPVSLTSGALEIPTGLALEPSGDLIACDLRLGSVFRIKVKTDGEQPLQLARVAAPRGIAVGPSGEIVVLSAGPDALLRLGADGTLSVLKKGKPFAFPFGLARDAAHDRYLVSDADTATLWAVDASGSVTPWVRGKPLIRPEGLAFDSTGTLLVADPGASRVFRVHSPDRIEPLELGAKFLP